TRPVGGKLIGVRNTRTDDHRRRMTPFLRAAVYGIPIAHSAFSNLVCENINRTRHRNYRSEATVARRSIYAESDSALTPQAHYAIQVHVYRSKISFTAKL